MPPGFARLLSLMVGLFKTTLKISIYGSRRSGRGPMGKQWALLYVVGGSEDSRSLPAFGLESVVEKR